MLATGPTPAELKIVGEHFAYLQGLVEAGVVLLAGRTLNSDVSAFGIVILLAESESEARRIMDNNPAVAQGVMRAELFPYRVALWSKSFQA
jgi:uncharacterized protein